MIVYRIEHPSDGRGPYLHTEAGCTMPLDCSRMAHRPGPDRDLVLRHLLAKDLDPFVFAFRSKEDLLAWFDDDASRDELAEWEFEVHAYNLRDEGLCMVAPRGDLGRYDAIVGSTQVMMRREAAVLVESWRFADFLKIAQPLHAEPSRAHVRIRSVCTPRIQR